MSVPERPARRPICEVRVVAVLAAIVVGGAVVLVLLLRGGGSTPPVAELAARLGCTGFVPDPGTELFVREQGSCEVSGAKVTLYTFASGQNRGGWLSVASDFGGTYVVDDRWIVAVESQQSADVVHAKLGGDIR